MRKMRLKQAIPFAVWVLVSIASGLPAPMRVHAGRTEPVASYQIDVTFDVEARTLTSREIVAYFNTGYDPIPNALFHLYVKAFSGPDTVYMQERGMRPKDAG